MTPIMFDTAVIIVMLLSVIVAFFRGFVKEVLTIVNLIGATAASWYLGKQFAPAFQKWMGAGTPPVDEDTPYKVMGMVTPEVAGTFLSYFTVFFITLIILALAGMAIASSVKAMGLGPLDKFLGMVFGALRGFLLVLLIYAPFAHFAPPDKKDYPDWVRKSVSFVELDASYNWLAEYLSDGEEEPAPGEPRKPDGPFMRQLKKMEDDLIREQKEEQTRSSDAPAAPDDIHSEILSDEEMHIRR